MGPTCRADEVAVGSLPVVVKRIVAVGDGGW